MQRKKKNCDYTGGKKGVVKGDKKKVFKDSYFPKEKA